VLVPTLIIIAGLVVINLLPIPKVILPVISLAAEPVFDLFGFTITNTLLASWLSMIILIVGCWLIARKPKTIPGRWQSLLEMIVEGFYGLVEGAAGPKWAPKFFPIVTTLFLFIVVSNWMGLTPLFGSWGPLHPAEHGHAGNPVNCYFGGTVCILQEGEAAQEGAGDVPHEGEEESFILIPAFRGAATDLNVTMALAIVSVFLAQYFGVKALGIGYFGKFIAVGRIVRAFREPGLGCGGRIGMFGMGLIDIFIGVVEMISEIGKIVSFSFRLFGNIFAGEVLLVVMAFLIAYIVSLPFYGLELFVGFVQALVFMMLSVAFWVVAVSSHGEEGH
jgi:F-type H+-transporting ATPase subunit a